MVLLACICWILINLHIFFASSLLTMYFPNTRTMLVKKLLNQWGTNYIPFYVYNYIHTHTHTCALVRTYLYHQYRRNECTSMQSLLDHVITWASQHGVSISTAKCFSMHIPPSTSMPRQCYLTIGSSTLPGVSSMRILGVVLYDNLSWST